MNELKVNMELYRSIPSYKNHIDTILYGDGAGGDGLDEEYEYYGIQSVEKFFTTKKMDDGYNCMSLVDDAVDEWSEVNVVVPRTRSVTRGRYDCDAVFSHKPGQDSYPMDMRQELKERIFRIWRHAMGAKTGMNMFVSLDLSGKNGNDVFVVHVHLGRKPPKQGEWRKV